MEPDQSKLPKTLLWGMVTVILYGVLFYHADAFLRLAHTTLDACAVGSNHTQYYNKISPELCGAQGGSYIEGIWWYVFAPIAMAFALSFTHGNFTSLFWDTIGLKAKK